MKRKLLFIALFCMVALSAAAQNGYKNAAGVRGIFGVEASYQRYVTAQTRLEGTLGLNHYGFTAAALHQWTFELPINTDGIWQWYLGAGAALGSWDKGAKFDNDFTLGVLAQAGIEYTLPSFPLMFSLDYRPGLYFIADTKFDARTLAVAVRFCF